MNNGRRGWRGGHDHRRRWWWWLRLLRWRQREVDVALGRRFLGFADEFVSLFLRHLPTAHHVLDQIARGISRELCHASRGADDIAHGCRHLAAGFLTDLLCLGRHFGDRVTNVGAPMPRCALRRRGGRRVASRCGRVRCRFRVRCMRLIRHGRACKGVVGLSPARGGKYMIVRHLRKRRSLVAGSATLPIIAELP